MCGRYSLYESMDFYLRQLALDLVVINGYDEAPINRYNVAPRSQAALIREAPGGLSVGTVPWGWAPPWATGKGPIPINARAETVTQSPFFKALWPGGRALAPANGWFEWVSDPDALKGKQPYHIQAANGEALFFAALADARPEQGGGFVVLTTAADGGLATIHARKPLVLTPALAREWLDPRTTVQRAEAIVHSAGRPASTFTWHKVDASVGNVRCEGAQLIEPLCG